jgi:hypothetical protein
MTPVEQLRAVECGLESAQPGSASRTVSGIKPRLLDQRGTSHELRAGRQLLIFIGLLLVLLDGAAPPSPGKPKEPREACRHMGQVVVTPFLEGVSEAITFSILCLPAVVVGKNRGAQIQRIWSALAFSRYYRGNCYPVLGSCSMQGL